MELLIFQATDLIDLHEADIEGAGRDALGHRHAFFEERHHL